MTHPCELPETESLAPTPWWQQRSVVRSAVGVLGAGGILVALAGASAAVMLVSSGAGEDTLRAAAPEVILTPSGSPTVEPTPEPKLSETTTPSRAATTSPAAPTMTAAATPSRSPAPVKTAAAPAAAGQPSPTKSAAPTPSPTGTAPGEVYITFINQTTQELRFSADTVDPGSKPVTVVAAPGTQKRIVFHPNPAHATAVAGRWTQNPDCAMGDAPGLPAPGSYTIIQRYQAGAGPGPTACAGHSQMEMVSPDADGMMRP